MRCKAGFVSRNPLPSDRFFSSVMLLLHMDGSNGSTTFTDSSSSPKTVTRTGSTQISTAESKFGGASARLTSGNYLTCATTWSLGGVGNQYTIEFWIYLVSSKNGDRYVVFENSSGSSKGLINDSGDLAWNAFGYGSLLSTPMPATGQWHHVAVVLLDGFSTLYLNGEAVSTLEDLLLTGNDTTLTLGASSVNFVSAETDCYIDELRITTVARYTDDFTPPALPFFNP